MSNIFVQNVELVIRVGGDSAEKGSNLGKRRCSLGQYLEVDGFKVFKNEILEDIERQLKVNRREKYRT